MTPNSVKSRFDSIVVLPVSKIAFVLVHLDHIASLIVNADHGSV